MRDSNGPGSSSSPDYGWNRPLPTPDNRSSGRPPGPTGGRVPPTATSVAAGLEGWQPDPFGTHEERFFMQGEPSPLVRDGGVGSYDDPPRSAASTASAFPPHSQASPPSNGTAAWSDPGVIGGASRSTVPAASSAVPTATPIQAGWYQLPDRLEMARYWDGRQWEGPARAVEEIQHGVTPGHSEASSAPTQPNGAPTRRSYRGAKVVSVVFKIVAWLVIVGGMAGAVVTGRALHHSGSTTGHVAAVGIGIGAGSILTAAAFAFFAYVLDLLIDIASNTDGWAPSP